MNLKFRSSAVIALVLTARALQAAEVRTYEFSSANRPFRYDTTWGLIADAQLSGSFDLLMDPGAGTASLANIQARIVNPATAPPKQDTPLPPETKALFDNVQLAARWPTNLTALPGHFLAPDLIEFDGPSTGIFFVPDNGNGHAAIGFRSGTHFVAGYNTAMQLKLAGDTVTMDAVAMNFFINDIPNYFLVNAQATLVPEPGYSALLALGTLILLPLRRRPFAIKPATGVSQ